AVFHASKQVLLESFRQRHHFPVGGESRFGEGQVLDATVLFVRPAHEPTPSLQFRDRPRDLGLVHCRLFTKGSRSHCAVLAKPGQCTPFRPGKTETVLVDPGEFPAHLVGEVIESVGKEGFQFENFVVHERSGVDGYILDGYRCNQIWSIREEAMMTLHYMPGFGNDFETESLP